MTPFQLIRTISPIRWLIIASIAASLLSFSLSLVRGDGFVHVDERVYHGLATSLVEGNGYSLPNGKPSSYRPPGYPFFMALVYQVWPSVYAVKLTQAVLIGLIAAMVGLFAERVRHGSGWIGAVLVATYPLLQYTGTTLYPQTLALLLFLVLLWLCLHSNSMFRWLIGGLIYGYLILVVPSFLLLLPFIALGAALTVPTASWRRRALLPTVFVAMAVVVVVPWTVRNYVVFDTFIPVSTNGGVNLLAGNSPDAGPNTGISGHLRFRPATAGMSEAERDRYFKEQAIQWILEDPVRAGQLYALKFVNYFNFRNELAAASENPGKIGSTILFVSYYMLLVLVIARLLMWRERPLSQTELLFLVIYLVNGLISAIFYTRLRYRLPFDGLVIVLAAVAVRDLLDQAASRTNRGSGAREYETET
jgi:4-amino-4-deoxy-L-arabinose transferase-like glycosyltransferase